MKKHIITIISIIIIAASGILIGIIDAATGKKALTYLILTSIILTGLGLSCGWVCIKAWKSKTKLSISILVTIIAIIFTLGGLLTIRQASLDFANEPITATLSDCYVDKMYYKNNRYSYYLYGTNASGKQYKFNISEYIYDDLKNCSEITLLFYERTNTIVEIISTNATDNTQNWSGTIDIIPPTIYDDWLITTETTMPQTK